MRDAGSFQISRIFQAPPERLFQAWTSAEDMKRWLAPAPVEVALAEVDLRVGGCYRLHMRDPEGKEYRVGGTSRVIEPPRLLVLTWVWDHDPVETELTVEFRRRGTGSELVLTHDGLATEKSRDHHQQGWNGCLDQLAGIV